MECLRWRLCERCGKAFEPHTGKTAEADKLNHPQHLWLGRAQMQRPLLDPKATRQDSEVEHQRGVSEHEVREIDDNVSLGVQRPRERLPA